MSNKSFRKGKCYISNGNGWHRIPPIFFRNSLVGQFLDLNLMQAYGMKFEVQDHKGK